MKERNKKILTFYKRDQVLFDNIDKSTSKSPQKPYLLLQKIRNDGYSPMLTVDGNFKPFTQSDFHLAHTKEYVNDVFVGKGNYTSNGVPWSKNLVTSLTYTNASIYNAIKHAIKNPEQVCFSPTSGFHHAGPKSGSGFCTFSGQVIASVKIYREFGLSGAYLDLDGHFGNSIEDSREFVKTLNKSVPKGCNINPHGTDKKYLKDFVNELKKLKKKILAGQIGYVVFCHGADSHQDDDMGHQCSTHYWLECSKAFYSWVKQIDQETGKNLPVTLALFGGYRRDDYNSVLSLHMNDLIQCSNILLGNKFKEKLEVKPCEKYSSTTRWYDSDVKPTFTNRINSRTFQDNIVDDEDLFKEEVKDREEMLSSGGYKRNSFIDYSDRDFDDESGRDGFDAIAELEKMRDEQFMWEKPSNKKHSSYKQWFKEQNDKKRLELFGTTT